MKPQAACDKPEPKEPICGTGMLFNEDHRELLFEALDFGSILSTFEYEATLVNHLEWPKSKCLTIDCGPNECEKE